MLCHINQVSKNWKLTHRRIIWTVAFFLSHRQFIWGTAVLQYRHWRFLFRSASHHIPTPYYIPGDACLKNLEDFPTEGWPNSSESVAKSEWKPAGQWSRHNWPRLTLNWLPWLTFYVIFLVASQVPSCRKKELGSPSPHVMAVINIVTQVLWI